MVRIGGKMNNIRSPAPLVLFYFAKLKMKEGRANELGKNFRSDDNKSLFLNFYRVLLKYQWKTISL